MTSSNDTITSISGYDTITSISIVGSDTISIGPISSSMIDPIYSSNLISNGWWQPSITPFVNGFPYWSDFKELCDQYPSLDRALQNLKTAYTICDADHKQELNNKTKK